MIKSVTLHLKVTNRRMCVQPMRKLHAHVLSAVHTIMFENYYVKQAGSFHRVSLTNYYQKQIETSAGFYSGIQYQKGYGLGGLLATLGTLCLPILKLVVKPVGR